MTNQFWQSQPFNSIILKHEGDKVFKLRAKEAFNVNCLLPKRPEFIGFILNEVYVDLIID